MKSAREEGQCSRFAKYGSQPPHDTNADAGGIRATIVHGNTQGQSLNTHSEWIECRAEGSFEGTAAHSLALLVGQRVFIERDADIGAAGVGWVWAKVIQGPHSIGPERQGWVPRALLRSTSVKQYR